MEAASSSSAASAMKAPSFLTIPITPIMAVPFSLNSPTAKPYLLALHSPVPNSRGSPSFFSLPRCYSRPNSETNNGRGQDSVLQSHSPSQPQHSSTLSSTESLYSSSTEGLIFDLGPSDSWDSAEIGSPVVKRFLSDEEERWYMWYYGHSSENPGSDSIGLAISRNGIHWERGQAAVKSSEDVGLVMSCGKDWWAFDTESIRPAEVVIMSSTKVRAASSVYWLYYTGYSSEKVDISDVSLRFYLENPERFRTVDKTNGRKRISRSLPGLAISQDGRHWARIEGEHHSGALFDVGSERDWDSEFIVSPQVVFHGNGDLRMYYHSFDFEKGEFGIGMALSRDGIKWVKLGKIIGGRRGFFDEFGGVNACVVRNKKDGKYLMAYEGIGGDGERSIGLAVSEDGLKDWRRVGEEDDEAVLKAGGREGWDSEGVGSPCLIQMDGDEDEWRVYYRGIGNGGRSGIGMAVSEGSEIRRFTRWTGFHL